MASKIPHDHLTHAAFHLTYRLFGSVPRHHLTILSDRRKRQLARLEAEALDLPPRLREEHLKAGGWAIQADYEYAMEKALHGTSNGPFLLQRPLLAEQVINAWLYLHKRKEISLWAVCVMSNHVHVVLSLGEGLAPVPMGRIVRRHKNFTSRTANNLLGTTGHPFWAEGYFDRRIRQGKFLRVMWYVLNNPVKVKLVPQWSDWPNTWVHPELASMFTGVLTPAAEEGNLG
ncbi:transposase [Lewinella sp. IMCC34183]|uniref:transposase n=1 Tax=Lewinella sp. IMCC34183 TaxID=2248762 RepID=UPI000E267D21|nr:transposase [Lewinella sp. IMCC34183]